MQPIKKADGTFRSIIDVKNPLKNLMKKINLVFLRKTNYPIYLNGSLPKRNYIQHIKIHQNQKCIISFDISNFFSNVDAKSVFNIWNNLFHFSNETSQILTCLTTKNNMLMQGAPTSSYLANCVFFDKEPKIVKKLFDKNIVYSRYVDDILISFKNNYSAKNKSWAIAQVKGLLLSKGMNLRPKKFQIISAKGPLKVMGLHANRLVTLPRKKRNDIRMQVFWLEKKSQQSEIDVSIIKELNSIRGSVAMLSRLHPKQGMKLCSQLSIICDRLQKRKITV